MKDPEYCPECESDDIELWDETLTAKTWRCQTCKHEWDEAHDDDTEEE
jgi:rubredoxin